ncbi:MAG: toll/interleukin-1 receptor domain-containing protein [Rhodanobacteraceae bacterium]|nr:toll/interleukin-1 receptor domain-containing protein [Rhodanobacteraceae bacterium]
MAATLFISYAHKDEALLDELLAHLRALAADGAIDVWHDRRLLAGDDIFPNIEAALDRAQIVLLLVSEAFLASHECTREMWRALASRERRQSVVVPIILQSCNWRAAPYGRFNALPTDGIPIMEAPDRAAVYRDVAAGVRRLVAQLDQHKRSGQGRRRWTFFLAGVAACVAGAFALRAAWQTSSASARPSQIVVSEGVVAVAEISVAAPNGRAWNAVSEGEVRLPNLLLCFRHDEEPATEVCQPASFGVRDGRARAYVSRTHIAERFAHMTAWSETFSVDLNDRQGGLVRRIGRAHCRFGHTCELAADDTHVIGELLVLPSENTRDPRLRQYLDRCIDPQGRLAGQWRQFTAAAGLAEPDLGRMSQAGLAQALLALSELRLAPSLLDALFARNPTVFAQLRPENATRASVLQAASLHLQDEGASPLDQGEAAAVLALLRRDVAAAVIRDSGSCR